MSLIPADLHYRDSHEWINLQQTPSTVGITDHAQAELTDVVFVDLPKVGAKVTAGQQVCVIESVKAASDIYAPVSGEIIAVNEALSADPGLINRDPYAAGHIFSIQASDPSEGEKLMDAAAYTKHLG
jgi:glycine cleavage system H protein